MIIKRELNRVTSLIGNQSFYFNPNYNNNPLSSLDISPLLTNKTLIYITKKTPREILNRVKDFTDAGFTLPVSIGADKVPEEISLSKCILRENLFDEKLFDKSYDYLIKEDLKDENLEKLIKKLPSLKDISNIQTSLAFSTNWDLILLKSLKIPLYAPTGVEKIFEYKLRKIEEEIMTPPEYIKNHEQIAEFLKKINIVFPSGLNIDQIRQFRKEKVAIQFRNWMDGKLADVEELEKKDKVDYLIQEFNKLSKSYEGKIKNISSTTGTIMGSITGLTIGGPYGGVLGGLGGNIASNNFSPFFKKLWKQLGPNRWIFLISEFNKE